MSATRGARWISATDVFARHRYPEQPDEANPVECTGGQSRPRPSPSPSTAAGDDTIDVADGNRGDTVYCGPDTTVGEDTVEVDAEQDLSTGAIVRIDTATDCETVNEVLIN